jgi:hypothetical protein
MGARARTKTGAVTVVRALARKQVIRQTGRTGPAGAHGPAGTHAQRDDVARRSPADGDGGTGTHASRHAGHTKRDRSRIHPGGHVTRPASENATAPLAAMLLPNPPFPGFPAATAEAKESPVTQLPDAAVSALVPPPMGFTDTHEMGPMPAEMNPLPPALVPATKQSIPVGPAFAIAEKSPARAKGEPSRTQARPNADEARNANRASSATSFSLQNLTGTRATTTPSPR